jgi:hypothetical protein
MLQRFHARAPGHDRENRFFPEDFDELRQAGYLAIAVRASWTEAASALRSACASSGGSPTTPTPPRSG